MLDGAQGPWREDHLHMSCATEEGTGKGISVAPSEQVARPKTKPCVFAGDGEVQKETKLNWLWETGWCPLISGKSENLCKDRLIFLYEPTLIVSIFSLT